MYRRYKSGVERVAAINDYLQQTVIPSFINSLTKLEYSPLDGNSLTSLLHAHGINIRYLGYIVQYCIDNHINSHLIDIGVIEMISRCSKYIIERYMRQPNVDGGLDGILAYVLSLLVTTAESNTMTTHDPIELTHHTLWNEIRSMLLSKYRFELSPEYRLTSHTSFILLRSLCQSTGVVLQCRNYDFSSIQPIASSHIIDIQHKLKIHHHKSQLIENMLQSARSYLSTQQYDIALQCSTDALNIIVQVYGALHIYTANCHTLLASCVYQQQQYERAVEYQQNAVVITRRVSGVDSLDTLYAIQTLALYQHSANQHELALQNMKYVYKIFVLLGGVHHPDTCTALLNIAQILQDTGNTTQSCRMIELILQRSIHNLGTNHLHVALLYHKLAQSQLMCSNYRAAVDSEKQCKLIYTSLLPPKHERIHTSNIWLDYLTRLCVLAIKHQNKSGVMLSPRELNAALSEKQAESDKSTYSNIVNAITQASKQATKNKKNAEPAQ